MAENRLNRDLETREKTARKRSWVRPETLPTPNPEAGYDFHWIRISTRGEADPMNVSLKLREGWEPVKAEDHPEIFVAGVENERFKDNVVIGGLMLCKTPSEMVEDRNSFFHEQASAQMQTVDQNLMRENDARMPLFNERKTKVVFGKGT
jgi:hypothetical protein